MPKRPEFVVPHRLTIDTPYLTDYFGIWSIHEATFRALVDRCNGTNLVQHLQSAEVKQDVAQRNERSYQLTDDGIALIQIRGVMMKSVPSMAQGASTIRARQQLREAKRDAQVKGAMLILDTPGGTVSGNRDLADDVKAFAQLKPLYAFTEDLTASAGVSIASQATKRFANQATALYGAMGTYGVVIDYSGEAEKLGIKVHVVRAGEFKGLGVEGAPVTEAHLKEMQRNINALNEGYLETIATGLGKPLETIRGLADGRTHTAAEAVGLGLLDGVQTFEATYAQLVAATLKPVSRSLPTSQRSIPVEKTPATLAELKATFPKSSADWRESQLEAGADLAGASVAYATFVETKAAETEKALQKQLDEEKAKNTKPKGAGNTLGHQPLTGKATSQLDEAEETLETGDAAADFNAAVAKQLGRGPRTLQSRQSAIRAVAKRQPELYRSFLLATNSGKRQARLIAEKLETQN